MNQSVGREYLETQKQREERGKSTAARDVFMCSARLGASARSRLSRLVKIRPGGASPMHPCHLLALLVLLTIPTWSPCASHFSASYLPILPSSSQKDISVSSAFSFQIKATHRNSYTALPPSLENLIAADRDRVRCHDCICRGPITVEPAVHSHRKTHHRTLFESKT